MSKKYNTVVEYNEEIETLLSERPDKRKKKLYQEWLQEINELASEANKLANFKLYGKLN